MHAGSECPIPASPNAEVVPMRRRGPENLVGEEERYALAATVQGRRRGEVKQKCAEAPRRIRNCTGAGESIRAERKSGPCSPQKLRQALLGESEQGRHDRGTGGKGEASAGLFASVAPPPQGQWQWARARSMVGRRAAVAEAALLGVSPAIRPACAVRREWSPGRPAHSGASPWWSSAR